MDIALLSARLVLGAIFLVAGLAKLVDKRGSQAALLGFNISARWARPLGIGLPLFELLIAIALLPAASAWWGAVGAFILLLIFNGAIIYNLSQGRTPDCHCFGQLHSAPIGRSTLVRNGLLVLIAGFIILQGPNRVGPGALDWLTTLTAIEIVGLIAFMIVLGLLAAEGWLLLHLLQQNGRLLLRIESLENMSSGDGTRPAPTLALPAAGLPIGTPAPAFQLPGLFGETLTLDALRASGNPLMLIFSDPGCGPCNALLPEIAPWQRDYVSKLTIALVSRGTVEANRAKNKEHGLNHILLQSDREISDSYLAYGTPSAVVVRADGTIGSGVAAGADAIRALVTQTVGLPTALPLPQPMAVPAATGGCNCGNGNGNGNHAAPTMQAAKIGQTAPALNLPDLSGKNIDLTNFRGHETLVLFWNPGCGFCARMLNDLKAWEANPPKNAPKLLVVSTGTVDENQAMGLRSAVVLDQGFSIGRAFGAGGTPSAILVDAMGNIASEVVAGAPAVLVLAGAQE